LLAIFDQYVIDSTQDVIDSILTENYFFCYLRHQNLPISDFKLSEGNFTPKSCWKGKISQFGSSQSHLEPY
jgi:hypothetical protein